MAIFIPEFLQESNIINEAYIGDKPLEPILKQINKLRRPYINKGFTEKFFNDFNTDPELFKLNRMIEDFFGFKTCSINLINNNIFNAYTFPVSLRNFNSSKNLISTSNGFKFKKEAEYCLMIFIYSGIMFDNDITDREILALLLHEIGHNFSAAMSNNLSTLKDIQHITRIPITAMAMLLFFIPGYFRVGSSGFQYTTKLVLKIEEKLKKEHPELCNAIDRIKGAGNIFTHIISQILDILDNISILFNPISTIINSIIQTIKNNLNLTSIFFGMGGKKDEQLSDNFATMYGYGTDLNSALAKMENNGSYMATKIVKEIPFIGALQQMVIIPIEFVAYALDPHPKNVYRALDSIKYLEMELNNYTNDPKMKKEIKKEIDELYDILDEYKEMDFSYNGKDIRAIYNKILIDIYSNKPRKNIENLYNDMDNAYNNKK